MRRGLLLPLLLLATLPVPPPPTREKRRIDFKPFDPSKWCEDDGHIHGEAIDLPPLELDEHQRQAVEAAAASLVTSPLGSQNAPIEVVEVEAAPVEVVEVVEVVAVERA